MIGEGAPAVSEIIPGRLWLGGYKAATHMRPKPDLWIHCAQEIKPNRSWAKKVIWVKLDDDDWDWRYDKRGVNKVVKIAEAAHNAVNHGQRVLVTCHMGMNRSGLVTGLTLCSLGMTPAQAMGLMRGIRHPDVLCNEDFEDVVRSVGPGLA